MDIFQKAKALGLPGNRYVIVGGGILAALGLLAWDGDVDVCVAPETFKGFAAGNWHQESWRGKPVLKHDVYDMGVGFGEWSLQDLLADCLIIDEVPFISLSKLLTWKREVGRPKDLRHIALIEDYLKRHAA
jgi:hypothetical protein